ncbi:hypothetical protein AN958_10579 [Leucoagaricus sp. SymC.cos]|nr:hypothetical protein AN958_10579 [Leucoagaricus sp. SymC.cos]
MVLKVAQALADKFFPYQYAYHILIGLIALTVLRAFSQGRTTNRERDLHNRTFLVTGGFTPLGLTLLQNLAQRGAKIVALSPYPIDSTAVTILISLLRTTYNNEDIYAEQCDLSDSHSIRDFCMLFLTEGRDNRLDGIIFAHEYQHIGTPRILRNKTINAQTEDEETQRESQSLATFLITTLLLPALLVAPVERDIRIINVVNSFYAAAAASLRTSQTFDPIFKRLTPPPPTSTSSSVTSPPSTTSSSNSIFLTEGFRSLRTIIFTRHLQRIFDALPKPQIPKTEEGSSSVPIISAEMQRSNIVAVSVSPGISRVDTFSRLLNADWSLTSENASGGKEGNVEGNFSWIGVLFYVVLLPLLHLTTKSPKMAVQSTLHALFLPTPFKILSQSISTSSDSTSSKDGQGESSSTPPPKLSSLIREEVLKPGALYAECAVVRLDFSIPSPSPSPLDEKVKDEEKEHESVLQITDDGEYGGEVAGRMVWEAYEAALKIWEKKSGSGRSDGASTKVGSKKAS